MATTEERLPHKAVEENCSVIRIVDWLQLQSTLRRNKRYALALRQLRVHAVRTNIYICLTWFPNDHLEDLDLPQDAA